MIAQISAVKIDAKSVNLMENLVSDGKSYLLYLFVCLLVTLWYSLLHFSVLTHFPDLVFPVAVFSVLLTPVSSLDCYEPVGKMLKRNNSNELITAAL